jgi:hypothetical protein
MCQVASLNVKVKEVTLELGYLRQNQETIIAKRCLEQRWQVSLLALGCGVESGFRG